MKTKHEVCKIIGTALLATGAFASNDALSVDNLGAGGLSIPINGLNGGENVNWKFIGSLESEVLYLEELLKQRPTPKPTPKPVPNPLSIEQLWENYRITEELSLR